VRIERPNFAVKPGGTWELGVYQPRPTLSQRYEGGFYNPLWVPTLDGGLTTALQSFEPDVYSAQLNPTDLASLGNAAYNRLRPKVNVADLGQSIAEARDLPRMLQTTGKAFSQTWERILAPRDLSRRYRRQELARDLRNAPKGASDQFLNTIFGWKPFVKDVVGVCDVVVNGHELIERRKASNDKWQRRTFTETELESEEVVYSRTDIAGCQPVDNSSFGRVVVPGSKRYTITREVITKIWYVGEFKFYYPEFDEKLRSGYPALLKARQYARLLGANADPTLLYKLTPYTWMVDWFSDVGAGVQRLQDLATNSVVSKYFYVMRTRTYRYRLRSQFATTKGAHDLSWYYGATVKSRSSGSSPFGFNLKMPDLSGTQYAILAALGMSKWSP
jgi:hypothetical protein